MSRLVHRGWRPSLASFFLLFLSFIGILIPSVVGTVLFANKIGKAIKNADKLLVVLRQQLVVLEKSFGLDLSSQLNSKEISMTLSNSLQGFLGSTFNMVIAIAIMFFLLYFMLLRSQGLQETLFNYLPIAKENLRLIGEEIRSKVRANAIGIPMVALAQGIVCLIGFLLFRIEDPWFWAIMATLFSMIPFGGAVLSVVPVFIIALSNGHPFNAWGILLYGLIVVGTTDSLIRLHILKRLDNVHPLITLIGVVVGVPLFGFIGFIFGPLLISLFLIIVRIYTSEYTKET
jgi:predicted PurR-regulated permease PerM